MSVTSEYVFKYVARLNNQEFKFLTWGNLPHRSFYSKTSLLTKNQLSDFKLKGIYHKEREFQNNHHLRGRHGASKCAKTICIFKPLTILKS